MKLSEKILNLRKKQGLSQEELSEKLNVSRQAISRWEGDSALPDASNIRQLSHLFNVTADYLLNDEFDSDFDVPLIKEVESSAKAEANSLTAFILLMGLSSIIFIGQLIANFILLSTTISLMTTCLTIACVVGFEISYRKVGTVSKTAKKYYGLFYTITFWLSSYFPLRLFCRYMMFYYPRPYLTSIFEIGVFLLYLMFSTLVTLWIKKKWK